MAQMQGPGPGTPGDLPPGRLALYALPSAGIGFMLFLVSLWFLKFATDVLLLAPGLVSLLFASARIWDAVIDPLAGWISDRTRTRWGRRRPYMLAASFALPCMFFWLFNPPLGLGSGPLLVWCAASLYAVYTASTAFLVPHQALGAELSEDPYQRSRVFGANYVTWQLGAATAMATMVLVENAEAPRELLPVLLAPLALLSAAVLSVCTLRLRERPDYQGRGANSLRRSFGDVYRNPHARPLLLAYFIDSVGIAGVGIIAPYAADYLLGGPHMLLFFFGFYMIPAIALAPLWPRLARRVGKKRLWIGALLSAALGFGGFFFVEAGQVPLLCALAAFIGAGSSCAQVMVPSMLADVIDWDEWKTGERKEGAYSAARTFLFKSAFGLMVVITGGTLEWAGYVPGAEQSEQTRLALRVLFSLFPAVFYLGSIGFVAAFFHFDQEAHGQVRAALDLRASQGADSR